MSATWFPGIVPAAKWRPGTKSGARPARVEASARAAAARKN
jgi:hypothetical protein